MSFLANLFGYILNYIYSFVNNYGLAIIIFSVLFKLIMIPFTVKQQKTMKKSAEIQKKMAEIQKKYKNNPEKMNQETINLYKTEKMSPFAGCLPAILQLIIFISVFYLVRSPLTFMKKVDPQLIEQYTNEIIEADSGNKTAYPEIKIIDVKGSEDQRVSINMDFLGIDLGKVPTQSLNDPRVYIIPVLYVLTTFISTKLTMNLQTKQSKKNNEDVIILDNGENKEDQNDQLEAMQQMNKSMAYFLPIVSISIAIVAPLGLALYWLISNILMIIERLVINKVLQVKEETQKNAE